MSQETISLQKVFEMALGHRDRGELDQAEHLYRVILQQHPDSPDLIYHLAELEQWRGKGGNALRMFRQAWEARPDSPAFAAGVVGALAFLGYFEEAVATCRQAIGRLGEDKELVELLRLLEDKPYFPNIQGSHAPERQVYMSALVPMLGKGKRPIRILEIGTFMGSSILTWANAVDQLTRRKAEIVCIDPWEGADTSQYAQVMEEILENGSAHRVFRNAIKFLPKRVTVEERRGFSHDVLPTLAGQRFDIIYIDGCHLHPEVLDDIKACDSLLAEGGFICGDDLEQQLHQVDRDFALANGRIDMVDDPVTREGYHPGVTLGVGTFFGPVSVYRGFWVMRKTAEGYQPVSMKGATGLLPVHWPEEFGPIIRKGIEADGLLAEVV